MKCLGIDPDLHNTALALLEVDIADLLTFVPFVPTILDLTTASISSKFTGQEAVIRMIVALKSELSIFIGLHDVDLCVVEGQQKYFGTSPAKVEDLIQLSHISGAAAAYFTSNCTDASIAIPTPNMWKGSIPKPIHQARVLNALGWKAKKATSYSYPKKPPERFDFNQGQWKHLVDAIGLGWWGLKKCIKVSKS